MAQSVVDTKNPSSHRCLLREGNNYTTSLMREVDSKMEACLTINGTQFELLLKGPNSGVIYSPEIVYEELVENPSQATKWDRIICNQQLKLTWQNRCKKIDEIGIFCGVKPWKISDQKAAALQYLCIGTEDRRIFKIKHPHFFIEKEPTKEQWCVMEDSYIKTRNITYDRFVFFSSKQQKGESIESFCGKVIAQTGNYSLGDEETTLIRDTFILNILDYETQKKLLEEVVSPHTALEKLIYTEMRAQNQQWLKTEWLKTVSTGSESDQIDLVTKWLKKVNWGQFAHQSPKMSFRQVRNWMVWEQVCSNRYFATRRQNS